MRSEKQMMDLILGVARDDGRIRAVYMNGSRVNPNAPKDIFQDYDIVYVVTETASFIRDEKWLDAFGEQLIMQQPDKYDRLIGIKTHDETRYAWLILFQDGNRIDLSLITLDAMPAAYTEDRLTLPLLDKDHCLPPIPPPDESSHFVTKPSQGRFEACANEFWWCLQNVAKGIRRDELPYVMNMFASTSHAELDRMVSWWIGIQEDFQVSTGKMGKYFKKYLPGAYWQMYEKTFSDGQYEHIWAAVLIACDLFRILAQDVARHFGFQYPVSDDENMTRYLKQVRQ